MAYTSQLEVQTAAYARLMPNGAIDSQLAAAGCLAVYDWMSVPQNAPFDYITIGDAYEMPKDTLGNAGHSDGFLLYWTLHIWSRQRGIAGAAVMVNRLQELFHRQDLTLQTLTHVYTQLYRNMYLPQDTSTVDPVLHVTVQYITYTVQQ